MARRSACAAAPCTSKPPALPGLSTGRVHDRCAPQLVPRAAATALSNSTVSLPVVRSWHRRASWGPARHRPEEDCCCSSCWTCSCRCATRFFGRGAARAQVSARVCRAGGHERARASGPRPSTSRVPVRLLAGTACAALAGLALLASARTALDAASAPAKGVESASSSSPLVSCHSKTARQRRPARVRTTSSLSFLLFSEARAALMCMANSNCPFGEA